MYWGIVLARKEEQAGACSEGFRTTVFPADIAPITGSNPKAAQIAEHELFYFVLETVNKNLIHAGCLGCLMHQQKSQNSRDISIWEDYINITKFKQFSLVLQLQMLSLFTKKLLNSFLLVYQKKQSCQRSEYNWTHILGSSKMQKWEPRRVVRAAPLLLWGTKATVIDSANIKMPAIHIDNNNQNPKISFSVRRQVRIWDHGRVEISLPVLLCHLTLIIFS